MAFDAPDYFNRYAQREEHEGVKRVIFRDNFEATTLFWVPAGTVGYDVARSFNQALIGEASMLLTPPAGDNSYVQAVKEVGLPYSYVVMYDWYFSYTHAANELEVDMLFLWWSGTHLHQAGVRFLTDGNQWQYYDVTTAWTNIPNGTQNIQNELYTWNHCRLVVDFQNRTYIYFISNNLLLDLSAYSYVYAPSVTNERFDVMHRMYNDGANPAGYLHIDQVVCAEG